MRSLPTLLVAVLATMPFTCVEEATAQALVVDEGSLTITRNGAPVGRETFRIVQSGPGQLLTATGQGTFGERRLSPALSVDTAGNPMLYRFEARSGGAAEERIQATARGGRLSTLRHTPESEGAKEYLVPGATLLLDDEVFHHHAFVRLQAAGEISVIAPRRNVQWAGTVEKMGAERIIVDHREVEATRYRVALPEGVRDIWFDTRGRLLRVAIPARALTATRESLPD
jgi:hypothetical protein